MFSISIGLPAIIAVLTILSSSPLPCHALSRPGRKAIFDWNAVKYVYVFGDSYSFVSGTEGTFNFRSVALFMPCGCLAVHLLYRPEQFHRNCQKSSLHTPDAFQR